MVTINPSQITVVEAGTSTTSGCPLTGQYIFFNGQSLPYTYAATNPNYPTQVAVPSNLCIYYDGGAITTGCYCNGQSNFFIRSSETLIYTDNNGNYWALITISSNGNTYQFSIKFSTL